MDIAIFSTVLTSVKTASKIIETVVNGKKRVHFDEKIRELSAIISSLYKELLEARTEYEKSLKIVSDIEKQLIDYENWDKNKTQYKRFNIQGVWVYVPKNSKNPMEEKYWLCQNCISNKQLESVFFLHESFSDKDIYACPNCPNIQIEIPKAAYKPHPVLPPKHWLAK